MKMNSKKNQICPESLIIIVNRNYDFILLAASFLEKMQSSNLNINEIGFAKLKDLRATISEVTVELRGNNYPFAILKYTACSILSLGF